MSKNFLSIKSLQWQAIMKALFVSARIYLKQVN